MQWLIYDWIKCIIEAQIIETPMFKTIDTEIVRDIHGLCEAVNCNASAYCKFPPTRIRIALDIVQRDSMYKRSAINFLCV